MKRTIFCLVILLSGCGTNSFYLNGRTQQQYANDSLECQALAIRLNGGSRDFGLFLPSTSPQHTQCMVGKGYTPAN
jgi:hypothetical protein